MRFSSIFIVVSYLVTLAVGLVIPAGTLSSRDLEIREGLEDDTDILLVREPIKLGKVFRVGAGSGKPAQSFTKKEVKNAVSAANHLRTGSKTQQKKQGLKPFQNRPNQSKKFGLFKAKPFPLSKSGKNSKLHEFPLPNKNPGATGHGPARVIMKEKKGQLKYHGVVSHNQKKAPGSTGFNDHKRVFPSIGRKK